MDSVVRSGPASGIGGAVQPRSSASCAPARVAGSALGPALAAAPPSSGSSKKPASSSSMLRKSVSGAPRVGCGFSPRRSASTISSAESTVWRSKNS